MSTNPHFQGLFEYDNWANHEVLAALRKLENPPAHSVGLLAHIVSAERLWLERLLLQKQTQPVWPGFTLPQCESELQELPKRWRDYLASLTQDEWSRSVPYKNSRGENWTSQKPDIFMHVILHSAYHRGQIAADMRANGSTPAYTDFIHAVRQGIVE